MKLVTYDRRGARRLGAIVEDRVVDLPDLVGHPAYPTTMEALIAHNGGSVLEAAEATLSRDEWRAFVVEPEPVLLAPVLPASIRDFESFLDRRPGTVPPYVKIDHRSVLGPDQELPWPSITRELDLEAEVVCVIGRWGRDLDPDRAEKLIFGYTLMNDWTARDVERRELEGGLGPAKAKDFATSLGPCIVTADEIDPRSLEVEVRVDGERWGTGKAKAARWTFPELVAHVSQGEEVLPGDVYGLGAFPRLTGADRGTALEPGSVVEIDGGPLGVLRNPVGPRP
ncbi:MAG: fumarylacetoacetate hydrolase family protein [Actinobacteria bacterium]|nr:fumarylacetoacetate hydrolase family protein [Actinomycetota bacterium]